MRMRAGPHHGFTIIELMIVVAISGVLAAFALPNLRDMIVKTRLKTAGSDIQISLMLARSEAIKRNSAVTVTPVVSTDWSQGWSVKSGTTVLQTQDAYSSVTFTPKSAAYGTKTVTSITFQGTGREGSSDGIAFILTATGYPTIGARCVVLDPSGRPAVRQDKDGNWKISNPWLLKLLQEIGGKVPGKNGEGNGIYWP